MPASIFPASAIGWCRLFLAGVLLLSPGCGFRQIAVNELADALAGQGDTFASENDPQLVREALPFSLKLMESVLAQAPKHEALLTSTSSAFTQYSYAFLIQDADEIETRDIAAAIALRSRARNLLLRARDYGLRGMDTRHPGFSERLHADAHAAVEPLGVDDVPLMYWTAAAWAAAISISKSDQALVGDQRTVEALLDRSLALNEAYGDGAIHSLLISYEPARQGAQTSAEQRARQHFQRAVELSGGMMAGPYVSLAEAVSVQNQNRGEFESLLNKAIEIDVDAKPQWRLTNIIMQQRARWLLSRVDELFI